MADQPNPFLKNIERGLFTFNMHNMAEMCFSHVFKRRDLHEMKPDALTKD